MKKPMKAALLSALLFSGAGHLFLKRYIFSAILIIPTLYSLYYIVNSALEKSMQVLESIQNGSMQPDINSISELVSAQTSAADAQALNTATIVIIVCWIIGIVDAYRAGKFEEKKHKP